MINIYFGLPGCGKSTLICYFIEKYHARYDNIFTNIDTTFLYKNVHRIDNDDVGKYDLHDGLILIDEGTLFADSRDFKNFSKAKIQYFLLHRHYNVDIFLFVQQWDALDLKIRTLANSVYLVYKPLITGFVFTKVVRIPYGMAFVAKGMENGRSRGARYGEINMGYAKPSFFDRLFAKRVFRPRYYRYFDTSERPLLPPFPFQ